MNQTSENRGTRGQQCSAEVGGQINATRFRYPPELYGNEIGTSMDDFHALKNCICKQCPPIFSQIFVARYEKENLIAEYLATVMQQGRGPLVLRLF